MGNRDLYLLGGAICAASVGNLLDDYATLEAERAEQWSLRREAEAKVDTQAAIIAELQAELARLRAGQEPVAFKKPSLLMDCNVRYSTSTTPQPSAVPDIAGWLWHWLMDYCKKNSQPPATRNDLFAVVSDLRKMLAAAPSAPATATSVNQQLLEALEFAARSLATMTSADGSGHADIALCVLRMAGYAMR